MPAFCCPHSSTRVTTGVLTYVQTNMPTDIPTGVSTGMPTGMPHRLCMGSGTIFRIRIPLCASRSGTTRRPRNPCAQHSGIRSQPPNRRRRTPRLGSPRPRLQPLRTSPLSRPQRQPSSHLLLYPNSRSLLSNTGTRPQRQPRLQPGSRQPGSRFNGSACRNSRSQTPSSQPQTSSNQPQTSSNRPQTPSSRSRPCSLRSVPTVGR